jgi:hypothetical protein
LGLMERVRVLSERYGVTLRELEDEVEQLAGRVAKHLKSIISTQSYCHDSKR